jgi:hypothetical protein
MDPDACLARLLDAAVQGDAEAFANAGEDLYDWLQAGGFAPRDPRRPVQEHGQAASALVRARYALFDAFQQQVAGPFDDRATAAHARQAAINTGDPDATELRVGVAMFDEHGEPIDDRGR